MKLFSSLSIIRSIGYLLVFILCVNCKKDYNSTDPSQLSAESISQSAPGSIQSQTRTATLLNYNLNGILVTNYARNTVVSSVAVNDGKYAITNTLTTQKDYSLLVLQGFQFNIPVGATVENIAVKARRFKTGKGEVKESIARLVMRRERTDLPEWWESYGNWWANPNYFPTIESEVNYSQTGSGVIVIDDTTSYPYQWTPARINDLYFGVYFQTFIPKEIKGANLVVSYDLVEITVEYSIPGSVNRKSPDSGEEKSFKEPIVYHNPFTTKMRSSNKNLPGNII